MAVLAIDVGGSHVKALVEGETTRRRADSGPKMTAAQMAEAVLALVEGWVFDHVTVGIPSPVQNGRVVADPVNLGKGWASFDYEAAFEKPVKLVNDAAMQALGSYDGKGSMLFLGLGTGLGTALVNGGVVQPMEVGHLPYRKKTFEDYVGFRALERVGRKRWQKEVLAVVATLSAALEPDYVVLGGGNAGRLDELPPNARLGDNASAFVGGFRVWDPDAPARIL
jgi:polyphosphate glucokinase